MRAVRGRPDVQRAVSDHRVLDMLADEMGARPRDLRGRRHASSAEIAELGARGPAPRAGRPDRSAPPTPGSRAARARPSSPPGATLLDAGRLQDGEPFLAGTAPSPRGPAVRDHGRRASASTDGDTASNVAGRRGSVTLPLAVTDMVDGVVWLPTNSPRLRTSAPSSGPTAASRLGHRAATDAVTKGASA